MDKKSTGRNLSIFGRDGEVRKAMPSVCYANTIMFGFAEGVRTSCETNHTQKKYQVPKRILDILAGMARFELTDDGVKVRCLTAWLHPYIKIVKLQTNSLQFDLKNGVDDRGRTDDLQGHNLAL